MEYEKVVELFATGYACGILLSVLPMVIGLLVNFSIKLMKGEGSI